MKEIKLTQGKAAIVDDEDFEFLNQWKWSYNKGYASRGITLQCGKYGRIMMHRVINKTPEGLDTDHANGNRLDNRKSNLRTATRGENCTNRPIQKNNTSGFKGVSWHKYQKRWVAYVIKNKKTIHIGYFSSKEDAALAHNKKSLEIFGEFAVLNKVPLALAGGGY